jgi:hypothetical protein
MSKTAVVLVADDESVVRDMARRTLEGGGYKVIDRLLDARPMLWEGEAFQNKPFTPAGLLEAANFLFYGHLNKPAQR